MAENINKDYDIINIEESELNKLQYDILYNSTDENEYLTSSPVESLNKALKTENKRIILAINEILRNTQSALDATNEFKIRFNSIIGNEIADPTLLANLQEIDTNFFKAVYKIYKRDFDDEGATDGATLRREINKLNRAVDDLINQINVHVSEEVFNINNNDTITITNTPWSYNSVFIFINGVYYPTTYFNINSNNITWNSDEFTIDTNDQIIVKYHYIDYTRE